MDDRQKAGLLKAFCNYAEAMGGTFPNGRPDKPAVSHPEPGAVRSERSERATPNLRTP
jgi:hypothetical protein